MSKDEQQIEAEIQSKGLNAPRLNPQMIDEAIASEQYHVFPGTTLTVCALTLRNGYIVTGESAGQLRQGDRPQDRARQCPQQDLGA